MRNNKFTWLIGIGAVILLVLIPVLIFLPKDEPPRDDPWANVPEHLIETDHSNIVQGPFETGPEVTAACLECHEEAAGELMHTTHWTWESEPVLLEGRDELVTIGKKNQINNFCIGTQGNEASCMRCHTGYGWEDETFDFTVEENVDCLICHDQTGGYAKGLAGMPLEGIDLLASAQSVGIPTRRNCGTCHFNGGGGNAVKHGDLDDSLNFPTEELDVHMGRNDFLCIDCHQTEDHDISGRSISVSVGDENQIYCTDCHTPDLHEDQRLNAHVATVACQTCHIPAGALKNATKMSWDWASAGQDIEEDLHSYLKIKGSFVYEEDFMPEYFWFNGEADRYILGDVLDPNEVTYINKPLGDINNPKARIYPFKVHTATQIFDTVNNWLIQPVTSGEGGYWKDFDWLVAAELGALETGMDFSGYYGFTETIMFWQTTHMVAPKEDALACTSCHGEDGRMDWAALGYDGDPVEWGGRFIEEE